ncbi:Coadhesin,Thrombospondin-1,Mucin-like protein,Hemicentin-1,Thrombospondin-2 [Mytilus coruscus]|uniref:Coadhesin,Thrombospondin-1,Mucin-like protein,Hemicentin-1,Thrombospondin-2 n=1 Tax=Mytilus coruscus TaxID=42192 RepID=A0A6J8B9J1_MYTCO|nr:Coadhesin,Thrombospondin-1,Mucin-like protein,Hemicentin-1,Thrombospondin-2 [Mytilus coruscus]
MLLLIVSEVFIAVHLIGAQSTGDVRLTNSYRLEIYHNYEWGTVCDDKFDDNAATVACKQLGFSSGVSLGNLVEDGSGPIMLDELESTGSESTLYGCPSKPWRDHDCTHSEDVGVFCNNLYPVKNGGWSTWAQWTTCSRSCNGGVQTRSHECNNPSPKYGGSCCHGNTLETRTCNSISCPVNGRWSTWQRWTACSSSCGVGFQTRIRQCNNPTPQSGGVYCYGSPSQTKKCNTVSCPVIDGEWSTWTNWTDCSKPCNGGLKERSRNCNSPPPFNGGLYCNGTDTDVKLCNTFSCTGIESRMELAAIVSGVAVGSILISVAFVLIYKHMCARKRTTQKGTLVFYY